MRSLEFRLVQFNSRRVRASSRPLRFLSLAGVETGHGSSTASQIHFGSGIEHPDKWVYLCFGIIAHLRAFDPLNAQSIASREIKTRPKHTRPRERNKYAPKKSRNGEIQEQTFAK